MELKFTAVITGLKTGKRIELFIEPHNKEDRLKILKRLRDGGYNDIYVEVDMP